MPSSNKQQVQSIQVKDICKKERLNLPTESLHHSLLPQSENNLLYHDSATGNSTAGLTTTTTTSPRRRQRPGPLRWMPYDLNRRTRNHGIRLSFL